MLHLTSFGSTLQTVKHCMTACRLCSPSIEAAQSATGVPVVRPSDLMFLTRAFEESLLPAILVLYYNYYPCEHVQIAHCSIWKLHTPASWLQLIVFLCLDVGEYEVLGPAGAIHIRV